MAYSGGTGSSSVTTLQQAYNNSNPAVIELNSNDAFVIKNSDLATSGIVFQIDNKEEKQILRLQRSGVLTLTANDIYRNDSQLNLYSHGSVANDIKGEINFGLAPVGGFSAGKLKVANSTMKFNILNIDRVELNSSSLFPTLDDDIDLGTDSKRWKRGYFSGVVEGEDAVLNTQFVTLGQLIDSSTQYQLEWQKSNTQGIPANTSTAINDWEIAARFDNGTADGIWSFTPATGVLSISKTGIYAISYVLPWLGNGGGDSQRTSQIRLTGTGIGNDNFLRMEQWVPEFKEACNNCSGTLRLQAGWTINIEVFTNNNGDVCNAANLYQLGSICVTLLSPSS
jgi:hypothetical protein